MSNSPGNDDDRGFGGADRERQRSVYDQAGRSASTAGTDSPSSAAGTKQAGQRQRSNRGFASMDESKQREIASKGGRAAHAKGTAHEFDSGEAREAGRKGGLAVSQDREHMAQIGRRGGEARGAARERPATPQNAANTTDDRSADSSGNP